MDYENLFPLLFRSRIAEDRKILAAAERMSSDIGDGFKKHRARHGGIRKSIFSDPDDSVVVDHLGDHDGTVPASAHTRDLAGLSVLVQTVFQSAGDSKPTRRGKKIDLTDGRALLPIGRKRDRFPCVELARKTNIRQSSATSERASADSRNRFAERNGTEALAIHERTLSDRLDGIGDRYACQLYAKGKGILGNFCDRISQSHADEIFTAEKCFCAEFCDGIADHSDL